MKRDKPDLSRLVSLDLSPSEAVMMMGLLEGVKRTRGDDLGDRFVVLIDGTCAHIRAQLKQLSWPPGHNRAPYPV
jgi:hypothetical protein